MLVDFIQSPVGHVLAHHHRLVVAVDGGNGKCLVCTKAHYGTRMTGCREHVGIIPASHSFHDTARDRFFVDLVLVLMRQQMLTSHWVDYHHLETILESTVYERHLHSTICTYVLRSVSTQLTLIGQRCQLVTLCHPGLTCIFNFWHSGTLVLRLKMQVRPGWHWTLFKSNHLMPLHFKGLTV